MSGLVQEVLSLMPLCNLWALQQSFRLFLHCPSVGHRALSGSRLRALGGELLEVWSPHPRKLSLQHWPASGEDLGRIHKRLPVERAQATGIARLVPTNRLCARTVFLVGQEDEAAFREGLFIILPKPLRVQREAP